MRPGLISVLAFLAMAIGAAAARAQDVKDAQDPKDAPRLEYTRGPVGCLSEKDFRREVAGVGNGVDHFDAAGADVLRVWFEKTEIGFRGTLQRTRADGSKKAAKVETHSNCEVLGRWVAVSAFYYLPLRLRLRPAPASTPAPTTATEPAPSSATPPSIPAPAPAPSPPSTAPPPTTPPPRQDSSPSSPSPGHTPTRDSTTDMDVTIGLSGILVMSAFYADNVSPGFGIGVDVRRDFLSLGLEIRGVLPSRVTAREQRNPPAQYPPFEFDVSQLGVLLVPCVRFAEYFAGCGVLHGYVGIGKDFNAGGDFWGFSVGPRLGVEVPFADRFAVFGFGEALIVPLPYSRSYSDTPGDQTVPAVVWRESPVSAFFGVGITVKFQ